MNYIGSKRTLLPQIQPFFERVAAEVRDGRQPALCDLFAGTGIVGQFGRACGYRVTALDLQEYSRVTAAALLTNEKPIDSGVVSGNVPKRPVFGLPNGTPLPQLEALFEELEELPRDYGHSFVQLYCEGGSAGRLYLSADNGARVAAARDTIAVWERDGTIAAPIRDLLVAGLLEGVDRIANTASVYGAYLKHVKRTAAVPFRFAAPLVFPDGTSGRALRGDTNLLVRELADAGERFDLAYIDPPYNARLYASNYHLLETIARWDLVGFQPRGKTGLRPAEEGSSAYCSTRQVRTAVAQLLHDVPADRVLFSYSNEGLVPLDELSEIFVASGYALPEVAPVDYKRFRSDRDSANRQYSGDAVTEYLLYSSAAD